MTRFLIMLTCLFASATLGAALALFSGWPIAILSGALAFLFTQQMSAAFARRHDKRATAREITALRRMSLEFEQSLAATRQRMDDLTTQIEARTDAQGKKIVSELQVLESLMREFASRVSKSARAAQAEIGPQHVMQTGRRQGSAGAYLASMGEKRSSGNHSRQPGRKPRRSLSAAHRQPAAAQAALSTKPCRGCAPRTAR